MSADVNVPINHNERAVYDRIRRSAARYPGICDDPDLLADVACVALNRLPPRYIRHQADYTFYLSDRERVDNERAVGEAVDHAFGFVQARAAMKSRA